MSFHEVRFPASLSFGAIGGPERRTEIVTLANGFEERNTPWAHSRRRYDAGLGLRSLDDMSLLVTFFEARQGQLFGFRWKDWGDFKSCPPGSEITPQDQLLGIGDGVETAFPLRKDYPSGNQCYARFITKPVLDTVRVSLNSVELADLIDFDVDITNGIVTFPTPPQQGAEVRAGFEYDVPVRFDADRIHTAISSFQAGEAPSVPVIEVRV